MIEREMDNRGSKSVLISNTVKEQRVDGSYCIYVTIYAIKVYSNGFSKEIISSKSLLSN